MWVLGLLTIRTLSQALRKMKMETAVDKGYMQ